jgi:shikimate dehydrogenase
MKRAYVIGSPIRHSLSPAIHNAAFAHHGIDARYEAAEVLPEALREWVRNVRGPELLGFSVTIPHKEAIMAFLDEIAGDATLAGAVNSVIATSRGLAGLNTDTLGFRRSLADEVGVSLRGKRVVLLGAGGAARAVAVVALQDRAASLIVANRHVERAERMLDALTAVGPDTATSVVGLPSQELAHHLSAAEVVVNATSVGLASQELPVDPNHITPRSLVMDLIYNPRETALLRAARARGAETLGGLGMLVFQAAAAFEAWTGVEAPIDVIREAAQEALLERQTSGTPLSDPSPQGGRE